MWLMFAAFGAKKGYLSVNVAFGYVVPKTIELSERFRATLIECP